MIFATISPHLRIQQRLQLQRASHHRLALNTAVTAPTTPNWCKNKHLCVLQGLQLRLQRRHAPLRLLALAPQLPQLLQLAGTSK